MSRNKRKKRRKTKKHKRAFFHPNPKSIHEIFGVMSPFMADELDKILSEEAKQFLIVPKERNDFRDVDPQSYTGLSAGDMQEIYKALEDGDGDRSIWMSIEQYNKLKSCQQSNK